MTEKNFNQSDELRIALTYIDVVADWLRHVTDAEKILGTINHFRTSPEQTKVTESIFYGTFLNRASVVPKVRVARRIVMGVSANYISKEQLPFPDKRPHGFKMRELDK